MDMQSFPISSKCHRTVGRHWPILTLRDQKKDKTDKKNICIVGVDISSSVNVHFSIYKKNKEKNTLTFF